MGSRQRKVENVVQGVARALSSYIDGRRREMLDQLQRLVEIESPTDYRDGVNRVGDILAGELAALGMKVTRLPESDYGDHIVGDLERPGTVRVLLMGHMDTVYPVGTGWPFRVEGDRAYGPGVIDMKSGCLCAIYALKALQATVGIPVSVRVLFNSDEEPGSPRSREQLPALAAGIDYGFILEPAEPDGAIVLRRKGVGIFDLRVTGRAAHAGQEPEKGINANRELAHQIIAAEELADPGAGTTVNAGRIEGGTAPYVVSDSARARIDVRVATIEEQKRIERAMAELPARTRVPGARVEVTGGFHRPPMVELPGTEHMVKAISAAGALIGKPVRFGASGAASDGNTLVAAGVPTVDGMGPVGGRAHSRDEYLEIESFYDKTLLLALTLLHLAPLSSGRAA